MVLTFRDVKGADLTPAEADANIRTLEAMIEFLEENPSPGVGITDITQAGSAITIFLSNGSTRGPFTMPAANFRYRDLWDNEVTYLVGDFFKIADVGLYTVLKAHTTDDVDPFDPDLTVGGDPAYNLAIPFLTPPPTWIDIASVAGELEIDLSLGDKFRVTISENTEILFPVNIPAYMPPFVLDIIMGGAFTITFGAEYIGADPPLLTAVDDRNIVSGIVLDETSAILSTVKQIAA